MKQRFHIRKGRYSFFQFSRYRDNSADTRAHFNDEEASDAEPAHGTYGALLFDKRWIARRAEILSRDNNACIICKSGDNLQVHHRQYHFIKELNQFKAPWDYGDNLLITLCERCHTRGHSKYRVPNIYL